MLPLFPPEQMRHFDRRAATDYGIPGLVLMENAAQRVLELLTEKCGLVEELSIGIFCGPGNNGGDGFALARQLYLRGADVEVWLLAPVAILTGDARTNYEICAKLDIPLFEPESVDEIDFSEYDVLVDAIFGTGALRQPSGLFADVISALNDLDTPVVAVDIPSGVDAATGLSTTPAVQATWTVTFQAGKPGLYLPPGRNLAGEVYIAPISLPIAIDEMLAAEWFVPEADDVASLFPPRPRDSHKGNYGKLLLLAGSRGMSGAARLAASAALRTGVGLLMVAVPESIRSEVTSQSELMTVGLAETSQGALSVAAWPKLEPLLNWADAIAIGPGWGSDRDTGELLAKLLACGKRMVIDADGLNLLVQQNLLDHLPHGSVLTPHPGELERLSGKKLSSAYDRIVAAREIAEQRSVVVHVKGSSAATVSPDGKVHLNTTGNPGLATGGSGDVLTGMIGALLAQGLPASQSAWGGAFLHGRAADLGAAVLGEVSLLPSDVVGHIPQALASLFTSTE